MICLDIYDSDNISDQTRYFLNLNTADNNENIGFFLHGLTWPRLQPTVNRIRSEHADNYTTDAVNLTFGVRVMVFNATFNNISVISWRNLSFEYLSLWNMLICYSTKMFNFQTVCHWSNNIHLSLLFLCNWGFVLQNMSTSKHFCAESIISSYFVSWDY